MRSYVTSLLVFIFILHVQAIVLRKRTGLPPIDPIQTRDEKLPIWNTVQQRLDNFNPQDPRTWNMRYLSNDQFYKPGGPLVLFVGGEWEIDTDYLTTGMAFDLARQHNGYMFYAEHRFYGDSFPLGDSKLDSLIYLTTDQALADFIHFIEYAKNKIDGLKDSKVIAIGGSYAGNLAAWLRSKFPYVVDVAYVSSGPVQAVANFPEYFDVVRESIGLVSPKCLVLLSKATDELSAMLTTTKGITRASKLLYTCEPIKTEQPHKSYIMATVIAENFGGVVQNRGVKGIKKVCNFMLKHGGTPFESVAAYIRTQYNTSCISGYKEFIHSYSESSNEDAGYRSWMYQVCTEYGFFQPSSAPFIQEPDISYNLGMCRDIFGKRFDESVTARGIARTNMLYGGKNLKITKALFVYGTIDPWHPLGILKDLNPTAKSIIINGTSHCNDLLSISSSDAPNVIAAKKKILRILGEWLKP